ncbi:MAG: hypothetical protein A2176_12035 [Spirochaetes bacterium RBG_13_51_14]|nr:MAG: hypothetical protein A2176_12035 [Spirochaetes bacterium RBG_13_51_14]
MKKYFFPILFISLGLPVFVSAEEYSAHSIRSFARSLIGRKEYYRALVELKRLRSYYPGYLTPLAYNVTEQYLLFKGKQYSSILRREAAPADPLNRTADLLFRCDAAIETSDISGLASALASWQSGVDPFYDRCLRKRRLFAHLMARRYDAAAELCGNGTTADFSSCRELIERARAGFSYEKKPYAAALLGLLPGMGYIYAGEIATGIIAFLLITVDVIVTYFAFRTHNEVIGYFTGVIGGFFYGGSIAGGYLAAQRFNTGLATSTRATLSLDLRLEDDRDEIFKRNGIGSE